MDADEETTPITAILATFASIALAIISWTYGVVWAIAAGLGGLLIPIIASLDLRFVLDATKTAIQTVAGVLMVPLTFLYSVLLALLAPVYDFLIFVFSPILYPLWWIWSWHELWLWFLHELKPLYTFFGTAVLIGIIAGILLWRVSIVIGLILGWQDEKEDEPEAYSEDSSSEDGEKTPRKAITYTPGDSHLGDSPDLDGVGTKQDKIEVK